MVIRNIFTGGTIGSRIDENGVISTSSDTSYELISLYQKHFGNKELVRQFINTEPYYILSENLTAKTLLKLISAVGTQLDEACADGQTNGIIIMHGTDTLPYSAAILGYVFGDSPIPIILVSSNYVLSDMRANGLINYAFAIDFIKHQNGHGVFVSYCNKGGVPTIHRATRLQPPIPYSDNVESVNNAWYGRYPHYIQGASENTVYDDLFLSNSAYKIFPDNLSHIGKPAKLTYKDLQLSDTSKDILRIPAYPGLCYPKIPSGTKAILHESYHSGTIAVNDNLKRFAAQAAKRNIPIYLSGLTAYHTEYETVAMYRQLGIQPLKDCSLVAAYCKLWLAASNGLDLSYIMHRCVAEDFV